MVDSERTSREHTRLDRRGEGPDDIELDLTPSAIDKTSDPVRMYLREMTTVPLLTREGEIEIAILPRPVPGHGVPAPGGPRIERWAGFPRRCRAAERLTRSPKPSPPAPTSAHRPRTCCTLLASGERPPARHVAKTASRASVVHQLDGALFWGLLPLFPASLSRYGPENAASNSVSYFGRTTLDVAFPGLPEWRFGRDWLLLGQVLPVGAHLIETRRRDHVVPSAKAGL